MVKILPKVDVVTVGVGWAGGIVAAEAAKAGYKVIGLERGPERTIKDYLHSHDDIRYAQRKGLMKSLSSDTVTVRNNIHANSRPIRKTSSHPIGEGTGGSGTHWAGQVYRNVPYDFEIRTKTMETLGENQIPEEMTIQDWGITYDEIEPYYDKFDKTAGVSGEVDPLGPKRSSPFPNPPMKKTATMELFIEATKKLGYHPYIQSSGNSTQTYTNPDGQTLNGCQYCSFCSEFGCEYGAKSDPLVTVIPTALATGNFEIRHHAYVSRVLHKEGKATGVLYVDLISGEEFEQPAEVVVLGAYTMNNTRLLLLSKLGRPYDPNSGEGVIGKNLTVHHFYGGVTGYFNDKKFNKYAGAGGLGVSMSDFVGDNFDHSNLDFLHGAIFLTSELGTSAINSNPVPPGTPQWGKEFKEKSLYYFNRTLNVTMYQAIMPMKQNYVDLDPVYKDAYGDPLVRMTWDFSDNDRNMYNFLVKKAEEIVKEMGPDILVPIPFPEQWDAGYVGLHIGGGAIMGADPETSALNNYLQMWDCDNVFVPGANAFPHFGSGNPTNTVGALSYRAAEGVINYLKNGGGLLVQAKKDKTLA